MSWYIDVLTNNYLNFNGRARRTEFWMFALVHLIVIGILSFIGLWPFIIYFLLTVIPAVGVGIRRLHDTGRSGWWILLANSPLFFIYYYFMVLDGDPGGNIYGESPKESYMERIMRDADAESGNRVRSSRTYGGNSINLSELDPEKIFGNETYVQILIVVVIALSIILSWSFRSILVKTLNPALQGFLFCYQELDSDKDFYIFIKQKGRLLWSCF